MSKRPQETAPFEKKKKKEQVVYYFYEDPKDYQKKQQQSNKRDIKRETNSIIKKRDLYISIQYHGKETRVVNVNV